MKITIILLLVLLLTTVCCATINRPIDCTDNHIVMDLSQREYYAYMFKEFNDTSTRTAKWQLIFESLIVFSRVASGSADMTESVIALRQIEDAVNDASVDISMITQIWKSKWIELGKKAEYDITTTTNVYVQATAYRRAWLYYLAAERFEDHLLPESLELYNKSVMYFRKSLLFPGAPPCQYVSIPYSNITLPGYW